MKKIILYICLAVLVPINFVMAECCPAGEPGNYVDACIVSDKEGNPVCTARYYKNGNLKEEVHYKEKQIDGVAKSYYENGNLEKEVTYANGKKNGIARTYYENGNLKAECSSKDGKHSLCKAYEEDGKLKWECSFKDGKPDSSCKFKWVLKKIFD